MPGYDIIEQKHLFPYKDNGIKPNEIKIGFLDFLKEVSNDSENLPRFSAYMVVGIDEVLYMTTDNDRHQMARTIHKTLQASASALQRKGISVQIVCKGALRRGASLMLDYRGEQLPIELIFGTPTPKNFNDMLFYQSSFNLSS